MPTTSRIRMEERIRRREEEKRLRERRNRDREFLMKSNTKRIDHDYNRIKIKYSFKSITY